MTTTTTPAYAGHYMRPKGHHHKDDRAAGRPHILYCVRSGFAHWGLWRKLYNVQGINLEPQNVLSDVIYWHHRRSPTVLLQFQRRDFRPLDFGVRLDVGIDIGLFDRSSMGSHWLPIDTSLTVLSYLAGSKSAFARPSASRTRIRCQIPLRKRPLYRAAKQFKSLVTRVYNRIATSRVHCR